MHKPSSIVNLEPDLTRVGELPSDNLLLSAVPYAEGIARKFVHMARPRVDLVHNKMSVQADHVVGMRLSDGMAMRIVGKN